MTELELMQQAGWGDATYSEPGSQRILVALAEFLRSHNYYDGEMLCDVLCRREDYVDDE